MNNYKKSTGFSLVELLAVVVILGILSTISIVSYNRYINRAKEEKDDYNQKILVAATKSYLQANQSQAPKVTGERIEIKVSKLKASNYLKEDLKNSAGNSCMDKSYISVYKTSYNDYTYTAHILCGDDVENSEALPQPYIEIMYSNNLDLIKSSDVSKASFDLTIKGNSTDNSIKVDSYSYTISIKRENESSFTEVYNSGNVLGNKKSSIEVKNINLSDYTDLTIKDTIKVSVVATNIKGGTKTVYKTSDFSDVTPPICKKITGEPGENDWLNKKDLENNKKRTIKVICDDQDGSGCLKNNFVEKFPKSGKSAEKENIVIRDNAGNENKCEVRVNIDNVGPSIKIIAKKYLGKDSNDNILTGDAVVEQIIARDGTSKTLNVSSYTGNVNGWLNNENYSKGIAYEVTFEDDISLSGYKWEYNELNVGSEKTTAEVKATLNKKDNQTKISGNKTNYTTKFTLTGEGKRYAKLTAYDKAGNSTIVYIYANIDRTAPTTPTVSAFKKTSYESASSSDGLESYTFDTWYSGYVLTKASSSTDSISGLDGYYLTSKGQTTDVTNSKQVHRNINKEGTVIVEYKACDNAGNCSSNITKKVKLDRTAPTLPTTSLYKWKENDEANRPKSIDGLSSYTAGIWSNKKIYAVASESTDTYSPTITYKFKTTGTTKNEEDTQRVYRHIEAQGISTVAFKACDEAGNCSSYNEASTIKIDREAPSAPTLTMTHTYKKNNAQGSKATIYSNDTWINTNVYMTDSRRTPFTGPQSTDSLSGIQKYQISTDNKSWDDYDYDYTKTLYNITVEGTSKRYLRAVDNAGNVSAVTTKTIKYDKTPPGVPTAKIRRSNSSGSIVSNGPNTETNTYNYNLWWGNFSGGLDTGTDSSGWDHYEYSTSCSTRKADNISTTKLTEGWTYPLNGASSQNSCFRIRSVDKAGNPGSWSDTYYIKISLAPSVHNISAVNTWKAIYYPRSACDYWAAKYNGTCPVKANVIARISSVSYSGGNINVDYQIINGSETYIQYGYWIKLYIKNSSNTIIDTVTIKSTSYVNGYGAGSNNTGTASFSYSKFSTGTYSICIESNTSEPSYNSCFGTFSIS